MSTIELAAGAMAPSARGGWFNLRIRGRLIGGFAVITLILAVAVGYTLYVVNGLSSQTDQMTGLRMPASITSTELGANLYSTLATLRGYLLTGNPQGKADRAAMWKELRTQETKMDGLAARFTTEENKRQWAEVKTLLNEFETAQTRAEAIAFTSDAHPASKLLTEEAAPKAAQMTDAITKMINEEGGLEATADRKQLLKSMADTRGSLALGLADIRAFLLTGDTKFKDQALTRLTAMKQAYAAVAAKNALLSASQRDSFQAFSTAQAAFAPLPDKMFAVRLSDQWDIPVYILRTEAMPRALKILDLIDGAKGGDGTRVGGIKGSQRELMLTSTNAVQSDTAMLKVTEWLLLGIGLTLAGLIAFLDRKSVV